MEQQGENTPKATPSKTESMNIVGSKWLYALTIWTMLIGPVLQKAPSPGLKQTKAPTKNLLKNTAHLEGR